MSVAAWLLGDPGRTPFAGHVRLRAVHGDAWIQVAARVGSDGGLVEAFGPARALGRALQELGPRAAAIGAGRHALARALWQIIGGIDADALGAAGGADLSLVFAAGDPRGLGVGGVGLSGAWRQDADGSWSALVPAGHPLLAPRGRPEALPGVLTLEAAPRVVCASPLPLDPVLPAPSAVALRAGVRA